MKRNDKHLQSKDCAQVFFRDMISHYNGKGYLVMLTGLFSNSHIPMRQFHCLHFSAGMPAGVSCFFHLFRSILDNPRGGMYN